MGVGVQQTIPFRGAAADGNVAEGIAGEPLSPAEFANEYRLIHPRGMGLHT